MPASLLDYDLKLFEQNKNYVYVNDNLNRQNIAAFRYNSDGTIDTVYQFALLHVIGLEVEF